jgi:NAD(P) transhydrogenase subunit beta
MISEYIDLFYMTAAGLFIFGLKYLNHPETARKGNLLSMGAMLMAIIVTLLHHEVVSFGMVLAGLVVGSAVGFGWARIVKMTDMPQMVAVFNGFGGLASVLVGLSEIARLTPNFDNFTIIVLVLTLLIGGVTFSGSMVAFAKLQGLLGGSPILLPARHMVNAGLGVLVVVLGAVLVASPGAWFFHVLITVISLALGVLLTIPIGGADMPVVISLLNSYSGLAVAMTGLVLSAPVLVTVGSLVGAAGLILTKIMCVGMNRSLVNVLFGGFGQESTGLAMPPSEMAEGEGPNVFTVDQAVEAMKMAKSVIIVPGYGLAAAQAQHAVREMADLLQKRGTDVKYAIHPVAGRMPGHMNVLLAEANVPYPQLYDMDDINDDFAKTDVSIVIGANDVVNPGAKTNPHSPIYGMPVLNVEESKQVLVLKRSMNPGFAGIDNELFLMENCAMVFGDAKATVNGFVQGLSNSK